MNEDQMQQLIDNLEDLSFGLKPEPVVKRPAGSCTQTRKLIELSSIAPPAPAPKPLDGQMAFVDLQEPWQAEWQGMPEFHQHDLTPHRTLYVHFSCREDFEAFMSMLDMAYTPETQYIWWPDVDRLKFADKRWVDESPLS